MRRALIKFLISIHLIVGAQLAPGQAETAEAWTETTYPQYIEKVTDFGERADWSHDGKRILFVERSFGDVCEYNLVTGKYKPLTHHFYHGGYVRALYLSNGDILLSGPKDFPDDGRYIAFQVPALRDTAGIGHGIYILDLDRR